jgi:hypothetical protein
MVRFVCESTAFSAQSAHPSRVRGVACLAKQPIQTEAIIMKTFGIILAGVLMLWAVGCGRPSGGGLVTKSNPVAENAARVSAEDWLVLVDGGNYDQSWDQTSAFFKTVVSQADWKKAAMGVRTPLGPVVSRKNKSCQYCTSLPDSPKGKYVVIQYDTVFEKRAGAVETVTPRMEADGQWRVSGYYVK